ncbi:MAG: beta-glucosidase [Desulfurococcaceae archaeon]
MNDPDQLVSNMSIMEKISLIVGAGFSKIVPGAAGETRPVERLGIPAIVLSDGPAGVRIYPLRLGVNETFYVTAFPNEILLASSWNLELVEKVGKAIGEEAREYGVDVLLAPGLNIHRTPIEGRIFEYFSEDPLLSGEMAASYVRGVQSAGVGATLKHFVAHEQETNRLIINVVASERALREIYLRPFEIAIKKAKPWAVMAAYNKLNGVYCTQNHWLLTKVLREEWGFEGVVMTDWDAGNDPVEQVKAGVDLIMPGRDEIIRKLLNAFRNGELSEDIINKRVRNLIALITKSLKYKKYNPSNKPSYDEHARISLEAAIEGFVLLENKDALPLKSASRIALFGKGSYWTVKGGLGSGDSYPKYVVSIADGLREKGVIIDEEVERIYRNMVHRWYEYGESTQLYKSMAETALKEANSLLIELLMTHYVYMMIEYIKVMHLPEDPFPDEFLERVAERNDVALITISRISSEGFDRFPVKGDFYLRDDELSLISRISKIFHKHGKKVVVLLNVPGPVEIHSWRNLVDAILVIWLPGQEAGRAVASVLLGETSPSGKLPLTWPKDLYETPSMKLHPGVPKDNPVEVLYAEDIYVGYRYYDTFQVEPAYEFGYGLSYTKFEYDNLVIRNKDSEIEISLIVKNTGDYPGKEVVQVYVRPLRSRLNRPFQELKGFHKTKLIKPGEVEEVTIRIPLDYLASFNGKHWIVESGPYEIRIGSSSRKIKLASVIEITSDICYDTSWKRIKCN